MDEARKRIMGTAIQDGEITEAELVEADQNPAFGMPLGEIPEHIRVSVTCRPEEGSNIRIEIWLPTKGWNGDFIGTGNGGAAGMLASFVMVGPLQMGFAAANTDMGTSAGVDCGIGNPAVWKDFGYRATHLMTLAAKAVIEAYYGMPARHAYFMGSSTGGQQGLMEAQRFPEDYDGILINAPAYDRTNLHMGFLWDWLAVNAGEGGLFSKEDDAAVVKTILERCGDVGERHAGDDFMYRPDRIQMTKEMFQGSGFTDRQIEGLMKIYSGLTDPETGERIYEPVMMPGSEACEFGLSHRCEHPGFAQGSFYLFRWVLGADFDFRNFNFHKDAARIHKELDCCLNATDADLASFRDRGGKLLLIHGTADPIIPYTSSIRYYKQVQEKTGDVDSFFRLFLAPGMGHTSGGPGVQDIVFGFPATPRDSRHLGILALKEWVEHDKAPERLYPVAFKENNMANAFVDSGVGYEREIVPYRG